jgi:hypothetical protein
MRGSSSPRAPRSAASSSTKTRGAPVPGVAISVLAPDLGDLTEFRGDFGTTTGPDGRFELFAPTVPGVRIRYRSSDAQGELDVGDGELIVRL